MYFNYIINPFALGVKEYVLKLFELMFKHELTKTKRTLIN